MCGSQFSLILQQFLHGQPGIWAGVKMCKCRVAHSWSARLGLEYKGGVAQFCAVLLICLVCVNAGTWQRRSQGVLCRVGRVATSCECEPAVQCKAGCQRCLFVNRRNNQIIPPLAVKRNAALPAWPSWHPSFTAVVNGFQF